MIGQQLNFSRLAIPYISIHDRFHNGAKFYATNITHGKQTAFEVVIFNRHS